MSSVLSQYIVQCHDACLAHARLLTCLLMMLCLHALHIYTSHLLLLHTVDYFPFRYFSLLFATYVSICNVVDYMDLILTQC